MHMTWHVQEVGNRYLGWTVMKDVIEQVIGTIGKDPGLWQQRCCKGQRVLVGSLFVCLFRNILRKRLTQPLLLTLPPSAEINDPV